MNLPVVQSGVVRAACPHDCPDTCAMLVQVEDGRAVRVQGDPQHPVTQGFLCAKVNRYVERSYHPERVLTPMRRVGRKGAGRFVAASWDEALDDIASRLQAIIDEHGPQSVLPYSYAGTMGQVQGSSMDRRFFHRIGASLLARTICSAAGTEGWRHSYGSRLGPSPEEVEYSRHIILWGTNTLTSNPHLWPAILRARERGARVVAIDPIRTRTAAQCDLHLAIRPGTDAALALGMMRRILDLGLEDREFLTSRAEGWEDLAEHLAEWSLERTARVTGLEPAEIDRLARDFAGIRPSFIRLNYGMQRHGGGGMAVRAISLLPALTGAWRDVGGGATLSTSGAFHFASNTLERPDWIPAGTRTINMIRLGEALTSPDAGVGGPRVKALVVYNSNPGAVAPDLVRVREGLRRDDLFTVVLEHFQTDTADYADWILPATTQLEHWDVHGSYGHLYVTLNQPAIDPLGESASNAEIFRRLAARMGLSEPEFADSDTDLIQQALRSDHPAMEGLTFERLLREGYVRLNLPSPYAPLADERPLRTPSGKIEFRSRVLEKLGFPGRPAFIPPIESMSEQGDRFPLALLSPPEHTFLNSTFANVPSLARSAGMPRLLVNPADALARSVESGASVRIWNDRGEFTAEALVTDDVRPGVVVSYGVRWARLSGGHTVNDTTSGGESDLGGGALFYDNAVEVESVPARMRRTDGGEAGADHASSLDEAAPVAKPGSPEQSPSTTLQTIGGLTE